jgi:hypothetical protein
VDLAGGSGDSAPGRTDPKNSERKVRPLRKVPELEHVLPRQKDEQIIS